jgi:hypothetical protein
VGCAANRRLRYGSADILEAIRDVVATSPDGQASVKAIAQLFSRRYGDEYDRNITGKWIGSVIRRSLQLKTQKSHGTVVIVPTEKAKLARLYERYGLTDAVDVAGGTSEAGELGALMR